MQPHIFIGSSSEGLDLAKEIKPHLTSIGIVDVWDKDVFTLGTGTLEALFLKLRRSDFAILVCTPDDKTVSRGRSTGSIRDNVLFELGLFMGGLGRSRAYGVLYRPDVLKLPSDLFGITLVPVKSDKKKEPPSFVEAASQVAPTLANAITLQVAEWRNDLARSLDCRMIFMLRHLKNGHYRDVRYYTGVLQSFRCEPLGKNWPSTQSGCLARSNWCNRMARRSPSPTEAGTSLISAKTTNNFDGGMILRSRTSCTRQISRPARLFRRTRIPTFRPKIVQALRPDDAVNRSFPNMGSQ
jgi:CAP12/Pycsar effector protein, TIR domain